MPIIKDPQGKIVAKMPYNEEGEQAAEKMAADNPNLDIDYAPGGAQDASMRSTTTYAGGGKTGYDVPQYKKGGKTKKSKKDIPIGAHARPISYPEDWVEDPHKVETEWKGYGHDPKTGYTRSVSKQPGKRKFKTKKKK